MTTSEIFEAGMGKRCRNARYRVQPRLVKPSTGASPMFQVKPVTLREVLGVAHGNHGIVHEREKAFIVSDEGCANDERQVENCGDCQNEVEEFALGFHRREYIMLGIWCKSDYQSDLHGEKNYLTYGARDASSERSFSMIASVAAFIALLSHLLFFMRQFTADLIEAGGVSSAQTRCGHCPRGKGFLILRWRDQS